MGRCCPGIFSGWHRIPRKITEKNVVEKVKQGFYFFESIFHKR